MIFLYESNIQAQSAGYIPYTLELFHSIEEVFTRTRKDTYRSHRAACRHDLLLQNLLPVSLRQLLQQRRRETNGEATHR